MGTMYHGSYFSREQSHKVLKAALDCGINYLDCADRYGIHDSNLPQDQRTQAEVVLGDFIKDYDRSQLVISSKVWYQMDENNPNSGGLSRKHIRESVKRTLSNLGTDYLDLYFCHRTDKTTDLGETISTMSNLIDEGTIHYWGTSFWPPTLVERTIWMAKEMGAHPPHVEQPPYHMFARNIETPEETLDVARYHGMGLTTFEALATGLFTGKYQETVPEDSRYGQGVDTLSEEVLKIYRSVIPQLQEIASGIGVSLPQFAIAWSLRFKEVTSSIIGASKPDQVVENAGASGLQVKDEIWDQVGEILREARPQPRYRYSTGYIGVDEKLIRA